MFVVGTDRSLTLPRVRQGGVFGNGTPAPDAREELEVTKVYDPYFGTTTSATHIAALEIDPATCKVTIDRYVVAEDCGRVINPMIVDGQVHGAVAQGIGAALYEEIVYDEAGQLLTASLADYVIPARARCRRSRPCTSIPSRRRRWAGFAAWAKAARSARRRPSPTRWPTRSRRSAPRFSNCR